MDKRPIPQSLFDTNINNPCISVKQKYTNRYYRRRKIALWEAGIVQGEIAAVLGVSRAAVNHVVRGERFTPRIVEAICAALAPYGRTRAELFPELEEEEPCPPST